MTPHNYGITATQTLYNGFQTSNRTRQAESQVLAGARDVADDRADHAARSAATAYMNLLRDAAILDLQRRNVEVLQEQLRQTRDRFNVGEVTRTDVAQSESRACGGRARRCWPRRQSKGIAGRLPAGDRRRAGQACAGFAGRPPFAATLTASIEIGRSKHPPVTSAQYTVDAALFAGEGRRRRALSDA